MDPKTTPDAAEPVYARRVLDAMADSLIVLTPDLRIETVNEATLKLLGYEEQELVGKSIASIMGHPRQAVPGLVSMSELLFDERAEPIQLSYHAKDGRRIPVTFTSSLLKREGGTRGIVCVAQNDTRRKAAEVETGEARLAAETASRIKGEFLAMMNHELRTPLHGILGATQLLLDSRLSPEQREHAETVHTCGEALLRLVGDMLDFGRLQGAEAPGSETRFEIADCLNEAMEHVSALGRDKGLDLRVTLAPDVPATVRGDAVRLRQILMHLLGNAVTFTESGEVAMEVRCDRPATPEDPRMLLRFAVRDTGVGIPLDRQARVFEPFHRGSTSGPRRPAGVGLGLSIAKRLVEMTGGRIWLHSRVDSGSTFYFTFPLRGASAGLGDRELLARMDRMDGEEAQASRPALRSVVAGERGFCRRAARWLSAWGHGVEVAGGEDEGTAFWEANACDLLVVDLAASRFDAVEVIQRLRTRERRAGRHTAVVGVGADDRRVEQRCLLAGMDAYVGGAPVSEAFMRAVESAVESRS